MSLRTDARVVAEMLDPNFPFHEAAQMLEEHLEPRTIRQLRSRLQDLEPFDLEFARERGPRWLTSPEGQKWLGEKVGLEAA